MGNVFQANIAAKLGNALGPKMLDAVLTKVTPGTRTGGQLTGGTNPTTATYTAKGFVEVYETNEIDGESVKFGDRRVALFASTIASSAVPEPDDRITLAVEGITTQRILSVTTDPATAVYLCQIRGSS